MKRTKRLAFLLAIILVVSVFVFSVSASAKSETSTPAQTQCETYVSYAQYMVLCGMVKSANATISTLVRIAQFTPYNDVQWLLDSVDAITSAVFEYAASIGVEVVCEYTEYYIDGQYVLIDPIRVIPPLPPEPHTGP